LNQLPNLVSEGLRFVHLREKTVYDAEMNVIM